MSDSLTEQFRIFCSNLRMCDELVNRIRMRFHQITKRINIDYYSSYSETDHSFYVGSYGRGTEIWISDIDQLVVLPYSTYKKFDSYQANGQSALLQEVKNVLLKTYSSSEVSGDGQVIVIDFSDGNRFEVLPAFLCDDGSYVYPNSNSGGSWKSTNPKPEIKAMNDLNVATNKNLKRLCRMTRAWIETNSIRSISGYLIDTLAYKFISSWQNRDKSYLYYDFMSRDFFKFLYEQDETQSFWLAPGSSRKVEKNSSFSYVARVAYNKSLAAIEYYDNGFKYSAWQKWREIYGPKFPD